MSGDWILLRYAVEHVAKIEGSIERAIERISAGLRSGEIRSCARFLSGTRLRTGRITRDYVERVPVQYSRRDQHLPPEFWGLATIEVTDGEVSVSAPQVRFAAQGIEVSRDDILAIWPGTATSPEPPSPNHEEPEPGPRQPEARKGPGRPEGVGTKFDVAAIREQFMAEVEMRGLPGPENEPGWQGQADVERWIAKQPEGPKHRVGDLVSDKTLKRHAKKFIEEAKRRQKNE